MAGTDQPVGTIVTIIGNGVAGFTGDGGPATEAQVDDPLDVAVDADGAVYLGDASHRVRRIGPDGIVRTIAGTGKRGSSGDGGPAVDARLEKPTGLAVGPDGSLFVADQDAARIRRIDPSGIITTVVGSGVFGSEGDGGAALAAAIQPIHVAVDAGGRLYFDDLYRYRAVTDGVIDEFAGTGEAGYGGDGGPAVSARIDEAHGIAVDGRGNTYFIDTGNRRVRKVDADGVVSTVAGSGETGSAGDGGPATAATFKLPIDLAIDEGGAVFVSDYFDNSVRRIGPDGIISTITGGTGATALGNCANAAAAVVTGPTGLAVGDGLLYIVERGGNRIRRVALNR
jgi:sugar lactone lactonase YvrE